MFSHTVSRSTIDNRNHVNSYTNCLSEMLQKDFAPYLNQKIRKISGHGGWLKSMEKIVEKYTTRNLVGLNSNDRCFLYVSYTSLICKLSIYNTESGTYAENSIYFGRFDDETGILTAVSEPSDYRTDLNSEEFKDAQNNIEYLKKELGKYEKIARDYTR